VRGAGAGEGGGERDALWRMRMLGFSTGCPVYPRKRDEPAWQDPSLAVGESIGSGSDLQIFFLLPLGFPLCCCQQKSTRVDVAEAATVVVKV